MGGFRGPARHKWRSITVLAILFGVLGGCGTVASDSQECAEASCSSDTDGDTIFDGQDNCPAQHNPKQFDSDSDGLGNACDNCPSHTNPDQTDANKDGAGDICENLPLPVVCGDEICNFGAGEDKTCRADCIEGVGCRAGSGFFCPGTLDCVVPCDGVAECPGGEDEGEPNCLIGSFACHIGGYFFCPAGETASGCAFACDGVVECSGGSDESLELCGGGEVINPCIVNGICEGLYQETAANCPEDCSLICGDGFCNPDIGENASSCPGDCPPCGDGFCDTSIEDDLICPA